MRWDHRPIQGEADLAPIVALRQEIERVEPTGFPISPERLGASYLLPRPGWWSDFSLWERAGVLRGIGEVRIAELEGGDRVAYIRLRVHANDVETSLPDQILVNCEDVASGYFVTDFQAEVSAQQSHRTRSDLLERHGYFIDRVFKMMHRLLAEPISPAEMPASYQLRPLQGVSEVDAWLALYSNAFQDHYDFHPIAYDERILRMEESTYLPEFDLVVTAPDGQLAAFCFCDRRVDSAGLVDWHVDLIGTHRDHRGRGLAKVLLLTTMAMVRDSGGNEVKLDVDATSSTCANRLYEGLGFTTVNTSIDYRKTFE